MVFLKSYTLQLVLFLTINIFAFAEETQTPLPDITQSIEAINYDILDLEVSYKLDEGGVDVHNDIADISNELLYHEYQLGTPTDENSQWNESEQMILDAKIKLQALQEKIKLEGDWGQLRFRVIDFKGEDPGQLKLRYNYGF